MINDRYAILKFLDKYREYSFQTIQILMFPTKDNNLLNILSSDNFYLYSLKNTTIFSKEVFLSSLNNSVFKLLLSIYEPTLFELSQYSSLFDLYNNKTLDQNNYKYLMIYPIYSNDELLGAIYIYSFYQTMWQISNKVSIDLMNELKNCRILDIENKIKNKYNESKFIIEKGELYLSSSLQRLTHFDSIVDSFDASKFNLKCYSTITLDNFKLHLYKNIQSPKLYSTLELDDSEKPSIILYFKTTLEKSLKDVWNIIKEKAKTNVDVIGFIKGYQNADGILVLVNDKVSKKNIIDIFEGLDLIYIRIGQELTKSFSFDELLLYLKTIDDKFIEDDFVKLQNKLRLKKINEIKLKHNSTKVFIDNSYSSVEMKKTASILSIDKFSEDKNVSLKQVEDLIDEARKIDGMTVIKIDPSVLFVNNKVYIALINRIKNYCNSFRFISLSINFEKYLVLKKYFVDIDKYLYINDEVVNIWEVVEFPTDIGLYICDKSFVKYNIDSNKNILIDALSNKYRDIIICTTQSDIINYHIPNVSLVIKQEIL